jgi:cytochrome P450
MLEICPSLKIFMASSLPPFTPLQMLHIAGHIVWASMTRPRFPDFRPDDVAGFYPDPAPVYKRMKNEAPIFYSPRNLCWVISDSYESIIGLMKDERLSFNFKHWKFSPQKPEHKKNDIDRLTDNMLMTMPKKDHMRVRKLAIPAFSPRIVEDLRPEIRRVVNEHFDSINTPVFDFTPIARAIPLAILAKYVGASNDYQQEFEGLSQAILGNYDPTENFDLDLALKGLTMLKKLVAERRAHPKDDLISVMATTVEDGERLSETEMLALLSAVLAAGPDTTRDHLANIALVLSMHPTALQTLHDQPEKIDDVVRECVRWRNFGHSGATRFALQDMELLGQKIGKGEMIRLMFPCAMYDERVFPEPEVLDIHRPNLEKVVYFGVGVHYCLGAALARAITEEVITELAKRYPALELAEAPVYRKNMISRRMDSLKLRIPA